MSDKGEIKLFAYSVSFVRVNGSKDDVMVVAPTIGSARALVKLWNFYSPILKITKTKRLSEYGLINPIRCFDGSLPINQTIGIGENKKSDKNTDFKKMETFSKNEGDEKH